MGDNAPATIVVPHIGVNLRLTATAFTTTTNTCTSLNLPVRRHRLTHLCFSFTTASSDGSNDTALDILSRLATPSSILFNPRYTSITRPSAVPPYRTFLPSPTPERRPPPNVPSTISIQNLDPDQPTADMDKRHPSSFQQLEKLGEGTYATVCICSLHYNGRSAYHRATVYFRHSCLGSLV
jgi:hypothetical protein